MAAAISNQELAETERGLPLFGIHPARKGFIVAISGDWIITNAHAAEGCVESIRQAVANAEKIVFDLAGLSRMDTSGAWLLNRLQNDTKGRLVGASPDQAILLKEAQYREFPESVVRHPNIGSQFLVDIGESVAHAFSDFLEGLEFLGRIIASFYLLVFSPRRFRMTSMVFHIESFAFRSVPIIALINFLVGCIVAQQGIFQLRRFGASAFAVDLIGILVLRELAVLLTAIMVAGRSGSAITAEIGSMKMREEIDAMQVMGLDPVEVLVVPRVLALMVSVPLLTFIADMAAIFGGLLVAWQYAGISPEVYLGRLKEAISFNTLAVGLIKAPFMALIIGLIATVDGLAVMGSAESLGRQVTSSVVKSIFMVIVLDGLFAIFFASIYY